jgi:arylsulfatase A-like enzyme
MKSLFISLLFLLQSAFAANRPNILWVVTEDNASHWLGCYGNKEAKTPNLDALAARSHRFTAAYSNAPVCAVARATILMGRYSPSMGTQHMRSRHAIPAKLKTYVHHLRKAGYYCTNASKTDYNFEGNDKSHWDECSGKAHYKNRPKGSPFMAIFNLTNCHESSLFPPKFEKARKSGFVPAKTRLDPATLSLPGHFPDLPEIRRDVARYHDILTGTDKLIGGILAQLEKDGLAEDTIIFYYGDHGGPTPRGKRYLHDTGVRIPMIVHVPKKWQHLSPFKPGQAVDEVVAFVDLAPTLLSLAGIAPDANMQGRAFLGKNRKNPPRDDHAFLYADRFDEIYGMRRGLTNGRHKYVRHFQPHLWTAPYSFYQFQMPSWVAWQKAWKEGKLTGVQAALWENDQVTEELFDTQADPWEVNNLAKDPKHAKRLASMRSMLKAKMVETRDTAIIPEPLFPEVAGDRPIATVISNPKFPYAKVLDLAFLASAKDPANLSALKEAAESQNPITRFWGLSGLTSLGKQALPTASTLKTALRDSEPILRAQAAQALYRIGKKDLALKSLAKEIINPKRSITEQGFIANIYMQIRETKAIPGEWIEKAKKADTKTQPRLSTLVEKLKLLE